MDYFKLLDLEERYDIDLGVLNKNYFAKLEAAHPDRVGGVDPAIAIDLNKAYTTLKNDLSRAQYLLSINGFDISDAGQKNILSPEDLEEIWEDLSRVEEERDSSRLNQLLEVKITLKSQLIKDIASAFKRDGVKDALALTIKLKYLTNLIENIKLKCK